MDVLLRGALLLLALLLASLALVRGHDVDTYYHDDAAYGASPLNTNARLPSASDVTSPVQLSFVGVPTSYAFPPGLRRALVDVAAQILEANLDAAFEVVEVSDAGRLPCRDEAVAYSYPLLGGDGAGRRLKAEGRQEDAEGRQRAHTEAQHAQERRLQHAWSHLSPAQLHSGWSPRIGQSLSSGIGCLGAGPNTVSLPLRITVAASPNMRESAQNYLIHGLQNNLRVLQDFVAREAPKYGEGLGQVMISAGPFDPLMLVGEERNTRDPTRHPTPRPSRELTPRPTHWRAPAVPAPLPEEARRTVGLLVNLDDITRGYVPTGRDEERILDILSEALRSPFADGEEEWEVEDVAYSNVNSHSDSDGGLGALGTSGASDDRRWYYDTSDGRCRPDDARRPSWLNQLFDAYDDCCQASWDAPGCLKNREVYMEVYSRPGQRRLDGMHPHPALGGSWRLPLSVVVRGPRDRIDDALPRLLAVADARGDDVEESLRDYDFASFEHVRASYEPRDLRDVASDTRITSHPVQLVFRNADPAEYELTERDRASLLRYLRVLFEDDADVDWDLLRVVRARRFALDGGEAHLPVLVTVRGPAELSSGEARDYVLRVLRNRRRDVANHLKTLDRDAFRRAAVDIESFDRPDILEPTFVEAPAEEVQSRLRLFLNEVDGGYRLDAATRGEIVDFFADLVRDNLPAMDESLELVEAAYDRDASETDAPSIPVVVTARGPPASTDKVREHVLQILEDREIYFRTFLISLDRGAFVDASVSLEYYAPAPAPEVEPAPEERTEETIHPVKLNVNNAPRGYFLSTGDKASITAFVRELFEDHLDEAFDLVDVAYATNAEGRSLPLLITVRGPADMSDFSIAYVMDVLTKHKREIERYVMALGGEELDDIFVSIELHDEPSAGEEYPPPALPQEEEEVRPADAEETFHPVRLVLEHVPQNYRLSTNDRASLVRFVRDRIEDDLPEALELIDVSYAGQLRRGRGRSLRWGVAYVPLVVRIRGPADMGDRTLVYAVVKAIQENIANIELYLKTLDGDAFQNVRVSVDTFDFNDVSAEIMEEEEAHTPSWIWVLVAISCLVFVCCCCVGCTSVVAKYQQAKVARTKLSSRDVESGDDASTIKSEESQEVQPMVVQSGDAELPHPPCLSECVPLQIEAQEAAPLAIEHDPAMNRSLPKLMPPATSVKSTSVKTVRSGVTYDCDDPSVLPHAKSPVPHARREPSQVIDDEASRAFSEVPPQTIQDHASSSSYGMEGHMYKSPHSSDDGSSYSTQPPSRTLRATSYSTQPPSRSGQQKPGAYDEWDDDKSEITQKPSFIRQVAATKAMHRSSMSQRNSMEMYEDVEPEPRLHPLPAAQEQPMGSDDENFQRLSSYVFSTQPYSSKHKDSFDLREPPHPAASQHKSSGSSYVFNNHPYVAKHRDSFDLVGEHGESSFVTNPRESSFVTNPREPSIRSEKNSSFVFPTQPYSPYHKGSFDQAFAVREQAEESSFQTLPPAKGEVESPDELQGVTSASSGSSSTVPGAVPVAALSREGSKKRKERKKKKKEKRRAKGQKNEPYRLSQSSSERHSSSDSNLQHEMKKQRGRSCFSIHESGETIRQQDVDDFYYGHSRTFYV